MSEYNRRSRKTRHARRKGRKPRPSAKADKRGTRSSRRKGTKAIYRRGSETWCAKRGIPAHGQGKSRERVKKGKGK